MAVCGAAGALVLWAFSGETQSVPLSVGGIGQKWSLRDAVNSTIRYDLQWVADGVKMSVPKYAVAVLTNESSS